MGKKSPGEEVCRGARAHESVKKQRREVPEGTGKLREKGIKRREKVE